ncbi:hypothetical protein CSHISOI_11816 [Colletotrichum shisoi]|uniref:Uncharacterized protein n=1 Tax=Colletotrichum shisoi TaxID=2078593 RepID=A0A5Q4BA25_9PEZI|nr:hypothetical protein CSHISOI_11816 [Colletotrichum shisoi]
MLLTPAALLAILVTSIVADRDRIIGYRRVSKKQAADYKRNGGTLTYDSRLAKGGQQLGPGVYTSPRRGAWLLGDKSDWWCVVRANSQAVDNVDKFWIPAFYRHYSFIWYASEETIAAYIKDVDDTIDPKKAFRLSKVSKDEDSLQMLIPPGLLNDQGGGLGITVECDPDVKKLPTEVVDYDSFGASGDKDSEF